MSPILGINGSYVMWTLPPFGGNINLGESNLCANVANKRCSSGELQEEGGYILMKSENLIMSNYQLPSRSRIDVLDNP